MITKDLAQGSEYSLVDGDSGLGERQRGRGGKVRPTHVLAAAVLICGVLLAGRSPWFGEHVAKSGIVARPQDQTIHLTNADRGTTITVARGDLIDVKLSLDAETGFTFEPHGAAEAWAIPAASDSTILRQLQGWADHSASATALFEAQRVGTSTIVCSFLHPEDAIESSQQVPDFTVTVHVQG